ncbi:nitronate monooxygenase [Patescibacteria group bacterium]|nr:nitronate monooxygenase [Patescibacteria group bacterium]
MFEKNKLTKLLGIQYPVIQGGMAGISEANLVSAVSNAGGLGTIGAGLMPDTWLREEIKKTKQRTENPFAINLFIQNPKLENLVKIIIEEKVPIVFTGGGNPLPLFPYFKKAGIKIIPVVPSPRLAKKMEENDADAVVVEGSESGGHIGECTTFVLIPQTKKILTKIPLIAAGGIYDGKTAAAAFLLGADGIQMGTRFLASKECQIHTDYKKKILEATTDEIKVVLRFTGHPLRVIENQLSEEWQKLEEKGAFPEEIKAQKIVSGRITSGDIEKTPLLAGFSAGGIADIKSCKEIIEEIIKEMKETIRELSENL